MFEPELNTFYSIEEVLNNTKCPVCGHQLRFVPYVSSKENDSLCGTNTYLMLRSMPCCKKIYVFGITDAPVNMGEGSFMELLGDTE